MHLSARLNVSMPHKPGTERRGDPLLEPVLAQTEAGGADRWLGGLPCFLTAPGQTGAAAACGLACAAGYRGAGWILWYRKRDTDGSRRLTEPV